MGSRRIRHVCQYIGQRVLPRIEPEASALSVDACRREKLDCASLECGVERDLNSRDGLGPVVFADPQQTVCIYSGIVRQRYKRTPIHEEVV